MQRIRNFFLILFLLPAFTFAQGFIPGTAVAYAKESSIKKPTVKKKAPAKKSRAKKSSKAKRNASANTDSRFAALVIDAASGKVIYEKNATGIRYPASLTKMMTLYLTFDALRHGRLRMNTMLPVSAKAASQPPTNIFLSPGDSIDVQTALDALIVRSANDVAMVMAEALGGTQFNFAVMMNNKARELGMRNTVFHNPSGLPESRQISTAMDMARLAIALRRDFPEYYAYFNHRSFYYNGRRYTGHNRLLGRYPGADGVKTGYIGASGFNLVTSVKRGNTYLVGVIMGGTTGASRDKQMMDMLDDAFITIASARTTKPVTPKHALTQASPFNPPERMEEKPEAPIADEPTIVTQAAQNWSVQIGIFSTIENANTAIARARKIAPNELRNAKARYIQTKLRGKPHVRTRLGGLTADDAKKACAALAAENRQCLLIRGGK